MAEVRHFEFGPVSPGLALVSAILGCLLGIILMAKAQKVSGVRRVRLLSYASVAIGVTAVWQSNVLAMMGLGVPGSILRLDPAAMLMSLGLAIGSIGAGLFLVGFGRVGFLRLVGSGGLIGVGVAGTHFLIVGSVRLGGMVTYNRSLLIASGVMAMVAACGLLRFVVSLRGLRSAIAAAVASALVICGVHYVGEYAIGVHLGPVPGLPAPLTGVAPMMIILPTMVFGGVMTAMLWFFSMGTSTLRDLKSVFSDGEQSGQIEPWIIDAVTRRVTTPPPGPAGATMAPYNIHARRSRIPSVMPVFRSMHVARTLDPHTGPSSLIVPTHPATASEPRHAPGWPDRIPVPAVRSPEPAAPTPEPTQAKDRNTRRPIDVRNAEDRTATLRRVSTVHREPPPAAGVVPVSPAPGLPMRRRPPVTTTVADATEADTARPRNRRRD